MIWLILLLGLGLRLISLDQSLWLDEAINVLATQNFSFLGMITDYAKADFHPPLYFIILWIWTKLFGISEIAVRVPSVIFGALTIYAVYLIGNKLQSKNLGTLSALLLAVNPLHIYYSQEARMYSLAAFAATLNFLFFMRGAIGETEQVGKKIRVGYLVSSLMVLGSDYLAYLIFPAQFIFILLTKKLQFLKWWLITLIIVVSGFFWWIPVFLDQLNVGQATAFNVPAWKTVVGEAGIKPLILTYVKFIIGRISHPDLFIYGLLFLPAGILFAFLIWRTLRFGKFDKILILIWIGIPIILAWLVSFIIPIYSYFRLLFVLPAFILFIAIGISTFRFRIRYLLLSLVILIEVISSSIYLFNPTFQREDWKGLMNFLKTVPSNSKIVFESNGSFAPFDYYADSQIKGMGGLKNFPVKDFSDLADLKSALGDSSNVYLINYLVDISDPKRLVQKRLSELNYVQTEIKNFNGVGFVYHYVKNE